MNAWREEHFPSIGPTSSPSEASPSERESPQNIVVSLGGADSLLFDGDCGLCAAFAEWMRRRDRHLIVIPYQDVPEDVLHAVGLRRSECARRVYVLTRRGRRWGGVFGINALLWRLPLWRPLLVVIYAVPPLLLIEMALYAAIARTRHHISRWLGLRACRTGLRAPHI